MGDNLGLPGSQLMGLQCVKPSSCLFIGFCFLRQEAGLELPMSEDDLELLSPWPPPPCATMIGIGRYAQLVLNY